MSPAPTDELERRLGSALAAKAASVTDAPTIDGRAAVSRRVAARARHRRTVRIVGSLAVVVVVLAAGLAWSHDSSGNGNGKVAVVPGQPAVQLPHVGLTGQGDQWTLREYSPGREEELYLAPAGSSPNAPYALLVTPDASAGPLPARTSLSAEVGSVRGQPATAIALASTTPAAALVWEIAPGTKALLCSCGRTFGPSGSGAGASSTTTTEPVLDRVLAARLFAIADRIAPVDDATWWHALQTGYPQGRGFHASSPLVLEPPHGSTEVTWVVPGVLSMAEQLDVAGMRAGGVTLRATAARGPASKVSGASRYRVHGAHAVFSVDAGGDDQQTLTWFEHGALISLSFESGPTNEQILAVANSLVVPSDGQWRALLEPSYLRTDLVPMPTDVFGRIFSSPQQGSFQGQGTAISTPTTR